MHAYAAGAAEPSGPNGQPKTNQPFLTHRGLLSDVLLLLVKVQFSSSCLAFALSRYYYAGIVLDGLRYARKG